MAIEPAAATDPASTIAPLTERVLARLGRPRWLWIVLWSAVPLLSMVIFTSTIDVLGPPLDEHAMAETLTTQVVLVYACFVALVGIGLLARRASDSRERLQGAPPAARPTSAFRSIGSASGPVVLTAIVVLLVSLNGALRYGPVPPLAALVPLSIYVLAVMTFVWVYLVILVDLYRIGREPLILDAFPEDRTLGLEHLGSLAATGLGLLLVAAVPVLLAGAEDPVTLGISLAVIVLAVVAFLLSMRGLHRQMAEAKAGYLTGMRRLYTEAYAPVRTSATIDAVETQASVLRAAQALVERAESLRTWPIDEDTLRVTIIIVTGIATGVVVRGLFVALGF